MTAAGTTDAFYDRQGNPISFSRHCQLIALGYDLYSKVAVSEGCGYRISTVWLGVDWSFGEKPGPPDIFETMIRDNEDYIYQERHSSNDEEALEGHRRGVAFVKRLIGVDITKPVVAGEVIRGEINE